VALFVILDFLPNLLLQTIYTGLVFILCGYACFQHLSRLPQFNYFTNGYIQFCDVDDNTENNGLWKISQQSLCSDMFIILICKNDKAELRDNSKVKPKIKKLYLMRDAVPDADYRRLTRTIKMLSQDD